MRGLFIGRFQPFHRGHLEAVKWILKECDELVIAIGSANKALTFDNPFTAGERVEMIFRTLLREGLLSRVYVCQVPDTDDMSSIWFSYLKHWCPEFDVVYTNDEYTRLCLEYAGIRVRSIPYFQRDKLSGTRIRELMASGSSEWMELVPEEVKNVILRIDGVSRISRLFKTRRT